MNGVEQVKVIENELHLVCAEHITGEAVNRFCFDKGIVLNKISVKRKSLETRFLEITGRKSDK